MNDDTNFLPLRRDAKAADASTWLVVLVSYMTQPLPPVLQISQGSASAVKHLVCLQRSLLPPALEYAVLSSQHLCVFPVVPRTCLVLYVCNSNP